MILCSRKIFPRTNKQSITVFNIDTYTYQNKLPISVFFKFTSFICWIGFELTLFILILDFNQ